MPTFLQSEDGLGLVLARRCLSFSLLLSLSVNADDAGPLPRLCPDPRKSIGLCPFSSSSSPGLSSLQRFVGSPSLFLSLSTRLTPLGLLLPFLLLFFPMRLLCQAPSLPASLGLFGKRRDDGSCVSPVSLSVWTSTFLNPLPSTSDLSEAVQQKKQEEGEGDSRRTRTVDAFVSLD